MVSGFHASHCPVRGLCVLGWSRAPTQDGELAIPVKKCYTVFGGLC